MAKRAKISRIAAGVIYSALSLYYFIGQPIKEYELVTEYETYYDPWSGLSYQLPSFKEEEKDSSWNNYFGAFFVACAAYEFLFKTKEEQILKEYKASHLQSFLPTFYVGMTGQQKQFVLMVRYCF